MEYKLQLQLSGLGKQFLTPSPLEEDKQKRFEDKKCSYLILYIFRFWPDWTPFFQSSVKHAFIQIFQGSFHIYGSLRLSAGVLPYVSLLGMCRPKEHGFCAVLVWKNGFWICPFWPFRGTLGTRGFSCVWREFLVLAVGRSHERRSAGHYKDLTETGNRARKASGTQGTLEVAHETESLLGRIGLWETLSTLLWLLLLLSRVGKLGQNSFQKQSHSALRQKTARVSPAASK